MKTKWTKRLLSGFLSLMMLVCLIPTSALAVEGDVAQIGDTTYATLDTAIEEAESGNTIIVLADASSDGIGLNGKNLTIQGASGVTPTITFANEGIHAVNSNLTFKDCVVEMTVSENPGHSGGTANLIDDSDLTFVNTDVTITNDHKDTTGESAIYLYQGSNLYIQDDSHMTVSGFNDTSSDSGIFADGSERDDNLPHFQIIISNGSTLNISECGWGGMTINPCDVTVSGQSTLSITNCGANGGKQGFGCYYGKLTIADGSTVDVSGNKGSDWGMFVKDLEVDGTSTLKANNNERTSDGIDIGGTAVIASGATVEAKNNADAGMRVYKSGSTWAGDVTIESGANITLSGNQAAGLSNNNVLTIRPGANVTIENNEVSGIRNNATGTATIEGNVKIQNNQYSGIYNNGGTVKMTSGSIMYNSTTGYGGGIHNGGTVEISDGVDIYNNHADTAGDDIYNQPDTTLTFAEVGSDWALDDCEPDHLIDGWYDDSTDNRWAVHVGDSGIVHAEKPVTFTDGVATVTALTALKAAHGTTFQDKTSYPGLDKQVQDNDLSGDASWEKDSVGAEAGEVVNFKLISNVPQDLINYLKPDPVDPPAVATRSALNSGSYILTFHDVMDSNLTLNPNSIIVMIGETQLNAGTDYTLTTTELEDGCTFEIELNLAALYENEKITDADIQNATDITVTYSATLNADVTMGTYPNKAWVTYEGGKTEENTVNVKTYAIDIYKYEQGNDTKGLSGAVFELYDSEHKLINTVTSGADGHIEIGGLDDGTYYLKETQAPNGYVCSDQELEITINEDSATTTAVSVKFANSLIPHTGGMGTTLFSIVGGVLIAMAGTIFVISRRKRRA